MPKISLNANPTFQFPVPIPIPGGEPVKVLMTFKHRTKNELKAFIEGTKDREDADIFMDIVSGWELDDPYTKESVEKLLQNYSGTPLVTFNTYISELTKHKTGN